MKKYFLLVFILLCGTLFSQKIFIQRAEKINADNLAGFVAYLALELEKTYTEKDKTVFYDNLFRINMVSGKHNLALQRLDSVRHFYLASNPDAAHAMGTQYEVYMKTLQHTAHGKEFAAAYTDELYKKYQTLSLQSQILLPRYFDIDLLQLQKEIDDLLKSEFTRKDSVDIKTALLLCRKYNSYHVAKESFKYADPLLKKWEAHTFTVRDSLLITSKKGHDISIRVVVNNTIKKGSSIVVNTIYSQPDDINDAKEIASRGYMCVYINARGKFLGRQKIEPFEHEHEDINEVIDWIVKQPWSNGKVGMIGGSYLGFSQWAATKKLHPALKTIIPQVAVGIGIDYPMQNNIFMSYMLQWLDYVTGTPTVNQESFSDRKKWMKIYRDWYTSGKPFNQLDAISGKKDDLFQRWLQHSSYDRYWQNMAPVSEDYAKINIPVLTTTGYFDDDQIGALTYYQNHTRYHKQADHYLIIGPYDHGGGQGYIKNRIAGLNIDPAANINLKEVCFQWFDYILGGKEKPVFLKDKINYEVIGKNAWKSAASMDEFDKHKRKYYLDEKMKLSPARNKPGYCSTLKVDLKDRSDADRILKYPSDIITDSLPGTNHYLAYTTDPFHEETEITGAFSGTLSFAVNKKDCDISMNLYEVLPDGKYFLLSKYIGRASYAEDPAIRKLLVPNAITTIPVKNTTFISKKIEKGSRLMLLVGINKNPSWQINYGTGKDVSEESVKDAGEPLEIKWYNDSYIEIPFSKE